MDLYAVSWNGHSIASATFGYSLSQGLPNSVCEETTPRFMYWETWFIMAVV